jgi:hypothetical protein
VYHGDMDERKGRVLSVLRPGGAALAPSGGN